MSVPWWVSAAIAVALGLPVGRVLWRRYRQRRAVAEREAYYRRRSATRQSERKLRRMKHG